jgi:hypothetical protein
VGRPTYERAVALVIGFDMAQPDSINEPMQARITARHKTGPLGWESVLKEEALGGDHLPVETRRGVLALGVPGVPSRGAAKLSLAMVVQTFPKTRTGPKS